MPSPGTETPDPGTIGYAELTDRIEQALGERPSRSALRAEPAAARRSDHTATRPRLTAGLPAPLPATSRTAPARFSADEVDRWLAEHPRRAWASALADLEQALRDSPGGDHHDAVDTARAGGLSWRTITTALSAADDRPRSVAGVHKAYRRPH